MDAKHLRRLPPVAVGGGQGVENRLKFGRLDGAGHGSGRGGWYVRRWSCRGGEARRQVFHADDIAPAEHHRALDQILQLSHVAWPAVGRQRPHHRTAHAGNLAAHNQIEAADKGIDQK
ncbi:hypothetical protein SDC9_209014 [bioreactor metagenome]|uniref:Uncharacterized protein n=1 Tax=bioreactor metagenome TaxID=1076179 RepID=A0A645JF34_9ZZZZ